MIYLFGTGFASRGQDRAVWIVKRDQLQQGPSVNRLIGETHAGSETRHPIHTQRRAPGMRPGAS